MTCLFGFLTPTTDTMSHRSVGIIFNTRKTRGVSPPHHHHYCPHRSVGIIFNTRKTRGVSPPHHHHHYYPHRSTGIKNNTRNQLRHREELYPYTLLKRNHLPYNSVAIYRCFVPLLICTTATLNALKQR